MKAAICMTLVASAAVAQTQPSWNAAALPTFNYSSDTGVGFGARGKLIRSADGVAPYWMQLEAQLYGTTGGTQMHFASVDFPSLFGSGWRLDGVVGFRRNVAARYYGLGEHDRFDEGDDRTLYLETAPLARVRARRKLFGHGSVQIGYRWLCETIAAPEGSLLMDEKPFGFGGGTYSEVSAGFAWDTRDDELMPTRGVLIEGSIRGTAKILGSTGDALGLYGSAAAYQPIAAGWVVAARFVVDATIGNVPFNRMGDFGTLLSPNVITAGVGGSQTVRGLMQNELVGARKIVSNFEVRFPIVDFVAFKQDLGIAGVAFVDAGKVDAGRFRLGAGGGLRIRWGRFFLVRLDAGYAEERVRFYADFGHVF